jgi:hypothetical protein
MFVYEPFERVSPQRWPFGSSKPSNDVRSFLTAALEKLHRALVPFRLLARGERAQVFALTGLRIDLSRI